jgi:glycosyltransferase involved in cell wall biosynthesis
MRRTGKMTWNMPRRLLTIGHSYVVALNRRLAHEMARAGAGSWEVTAVAPTYFHGCNDLRPVALETNGPEPCVLVGVPAYLTRHVPCFLYGGALRTVLAQPWDLVHCWEEPYILAGRQVAWWTRPDTALVYATFQNLPKRYPPPFNWFERSSLGRAAGWVAFGQSIADNLRQRAEYRRRPSRIIPAGVDPDAFRPDLATRAALHHSLNWAATGPPVVGFLGRFVPQKGLALLTRLLAGLETPWRALFVGEGELEDSLRTWASGHGDRVRICTEVRHAEVPRYLNAMDVLCAPSQTTPRWREQFGRMLVEAFACGVPVVGSDSGEIPHVVGDAGFVVGEADEAGWRTALGELLESPARRAELAARGLERARQRYAWPIVARQYLAFFEELLGSRCA